MRFTSSAYKELVVHNLSVPIRDGEAEVSDKATADALRGLPAELGVRAVCGRPAKLGAGATPYPSRGRHAARGSRTPTRGERPQTIS